MHDTDRQRERFETLFRAFHPGAPTDMRGGAVVQRYLIYRELTGLQASPSLVSLTARHPGATVVDESPAAWNAAEARLDP